MFLTEGFTLGVEQHHDGSEEDIPVPDDAANVLLLDSGDADAACDALLSVDDPENDDVAIVAWNDGIDNHLVRWRTGDGDYPASLFAVSVGELTRSTAAIKADIADTPGVQSGSTVDIRTVEDPADLTQIGIVLTTFLDNRLADDRDLTVCVDSLTDLLEHTALERAFQFLHVMTVKLSREGATAHYHLDPDAHDTQTVGTLTQLFDAIVERRDGEWVLRER